MKEKPQGEKTLEKKFLIFLRFFSIFEQVWIWDTICKTILQAQFLR